MSYKKLTQNESKNFGKLEKYVDLIEEKNKVMNLTGFTGDRLWQEGIYESIVSLNSIQEGKLLDIGAGVGFPSVPVAITNQNIALTIYEPLKKRTLFLEEINKELNLGINIKNIRAEETSEEEIYDYVTARAVASLKVLIEISHRPLKIKGKMVFIKGPKLEEEIQKAGSLIKKLDLTYTIKNITVENKIIKIIELIKNSKTPKGYPRNWAQIKKGDQ